MRRRLIAVVISFWRLLLLLMDGLLCLVLSFCLFNLREMLPALRDCEPSVSVSLHRRVLGIVASTRGLCSQLLGRAHSTQPIRKLHRINAAAHKLFRRKEKICMARPSR